MKVTPGQALPTLRSANIPSTPTARSSSRWSGIRESLAYASAAPFNIVTGADNNNDTTVNDRPAGVGRNSGRLPCFDDLTRELREGVVCPVLVGTATRTNGVLRLMKALRHEAPGIADTVARLGLKAGAEPIASVIKTFHTSHGGKMSVARVLNGQVADSTTFQVLQSIRLDQGHGSWVHP